MLRKTKKYERTFLDSLYRQYSPKLSKKELEIAIKNFEGKDKYEKKAVIAYLKYLQKANDLDNGMNVFASIFSLYLSTMLLLFKDMINVKYLGYIGGIAFLLYALYSISKLLNKNRAIRAEIEYLIALLDDK